MPWVSFRTRVSMVVLNVILLPLVRVAGIVSLKKRVKQLRWTCNHREIFAMSVVVYIRHSKHSVCHSLLKYILSLFPAWIVSNCCDDIIQVTPGHIVQTAYWACPICVAEWSSCYCFTSYVSSWAARPTRPCAEVKVHPVDVAYLYERIYAKNEKWAIFFFVQRV